MNLLSNFMGRSAPTQRLTLGGVELPPPLEPLHVLAVGSTGTGKTTLVTEALLEIIRRGDRVIVVDAGGFYLSRFGRAGDVVLNPFDARSPGWGLFNEVKRDFDCDRLSRSVVPDGTGSDAAWHGYAQVLLAEGLRALLLRGENSTQSLLHWLTIATTDELKGLLVGTAAQGLFDPNAAKALASTRFILTTHLQPHKYLLAGDFSLRRWLNEGQGNLFISWRSDMLPSLRPLVAGWVDILVSAVLSLPADPERRIWLIVDELAALGKLSSLESALTMGRKFGLCVFAGLQSTAQLDRVYGRESAIVLRSCFRNLCVFGIAKSDPDTAEAMSRSLGEREVEREVESRSQGPSGTTKSVTVQRVRERLVLPNEINELPDLTAFLALAGDRPTLKIAVQPRELPIVMEPIVEDAEC